MAEAIAQPSANKHIQRYSSVRCALHEVGCNLNWIINYDPFYVRLVHRWNWFATESGWFLRLADIWTHSSSKAIYDYCRKYSIGGQK